MAFDDPWKAAVRAAVAGFFRRRGVADVRVAIDDASPAGVFPGELAIICWGVSLRSTFRFETPRSGPPQDLRSPAELAHAKLQALSKSQLQAAIGQLYGLAGVAWLGADGGEAPPPDAVEWLKVACSIPEPPTLLRFKAADHGWRVLTATRLDFHAPLTHAEVDCAPAVRTALRAAGLPVVE